MPERGTGCKITNRFVCSPMLWGWVHCRQHPTIKDSCGCFAWIEIVVCKKRNKISCFTFAEPDCFTAERGKLSCLSFHLLDSFDFSWTSTWNIKRTFSSPYSPVNATKHEKPSASIIREKNPSACDKKRKGTFSRKGTRIYKQHVQRSRKTQQQLPE